MRKFIENIFFFFKPRHLISIDVTEIFTKQSNTIEHQHAEIRFLKSERDMFSSLYRDADIRNGHLQSQNNYYKRILHEKYGFKEQDSL